MTILFSMGRKISSCNPGTPLDPVTAQKVTWKMASQYSKQNLKLREQFVEGASDFLELELRASREELEVKERALSEFRLRNMGELPSQLEANLSTLNRLQAERTSNHEAVNTLNNRLILVQQAIHEYEASGAISADAQVELEGGRPQPARTPVDSQVALLQSLERDLMRLSVEYKDPYPDVILLKHPIDKLRAELADKYEVPKEVPKKEEVADSQTIPIFDPYIKGLVRDQDDLKFQIAALHDRQQSILATMDKIQGRVDRTAAREQELLSLDRDYSNMQGNYQDLLGKRLNARISENLEKRQKGERFRILDPANLPTTPEGPNRVMIVVMGLLARCAVGFGAAFGIEQWNPTFRRSEEAEVSLGFPILATIPSLPIAYGKASDGLLAGPVPVNGDETGDPDRESTGSRFASKIYRGSGKEPSRVSGDFLLVCQWRPNSIVAEQFRVAATRLVLMSEDRANTIVLATSAMKGEGKTPSVVNLGYTLARDLEKQTLLIGCDFKSPRIHEAMAMPAVPGLADYLAGDVALDDCLHRMEEVPLWVLPAGAVESHGMSLSKLPQVGTLLESLRPRFDYILLDAPPILPLADMNVLAGMADILILVVRAGVTPQEIVVKAMDMLRPAVPARILLTDASTKGMPYLMAQVYGSPYATGERV